MTAAAAGTAQDTIRFAGAVLHEALALPGPQRRAVCAEMDALDRALEDHCLIAAGKTSWEAFYPELISEPDPHEAALEKAAAEAGDCAEALIRAIAARTAADCAGRGGRR